MGQRTEEARAPMSEVERMARLICAAQHAISPDTMVVPSGFIYSIGGMQAVDTDGLVPMWRAFEPAAKAVIEDQSRRAEAGNQF